MAELTIGQIRTILKYYPETGAFQWKERTPSILTALGAPTTAYKTWNSRHLDAPAIGSVRTDGYVATRIFGRAYKLHKLAWAMFYDRWPDELDHINGDKGDNRIVNLREVTRAENNKNKSRYKQNSSGFTGVGWHKVTKKWAAKIRVDGRDYHLGVFASIEAAKEARAAAEKHYGFHENHGRHK